MARTSLYLATILETASHSAGVTAARLADAMHVTEARAVAVLRYWEKAGYLSAKYAPPGKRTWRGPVRRKARYVLTEFGREAWHEQKLRDGMPPPVASAAAVEVNPQGN